ncbi:NAD(P)H-binding protein [Frankia sp. AgKG'84/4]|uniref:NAD(P)H-binding protein n=1 Tax=Frankia sp. AgKG'84/4 TaxID=573490 RepID=UPI00200C4CC1|nr:NAD(P)H-binding protein [Frankia sp. AgKG'84/4]MCL9796895.1 NAD(P)H-binding protein [Frankia sp. AgKG'84/4]
MTVLVTGGRGAVARAVVDGLLAEGVPVRVASREPARVDAPAGVEVVGADLGRPESTRGVFDGVGAVFLYASPEGVDGVLAAAAAARVERIVLLSSLSAEQEGAANEIARRHTVVEAAIAASGLAWTFVRPGAFATNALAWAPTIRAGEVVREGYPQSHSAPIHERDIAAVSVLALLQPGHEGASYPLTGPESLTRRDQLDLIGQAAGRPVRLAEISPDQARAEMLARFGGPGSAGIVDALLGYQRDQVGVPAQVTDTVQAVTGRPARTFATWAADHAGDFTAD